MNVPDLATIAQAWIELRAEDAEATSAMHVARRDLEAGRELATLRRLRVFELSGSRLDAGALAERLHESTQFYNPAKERCSLRRFVNEPTPLHPGECALLVVERGGARRPGAERWWHHATGERIEVVEAVVWAAGFPPGVDGAARTRDLAVVRDRRHGLFCNPNFQDWALAGEVVPLPWVFEFEPAAGRRGGQGVTRGGVPGSGRVR